jgi:hypothetical protein
MIRSERGEKKLDWYIKWAASALVLSAIVFRSSGDEYHLFDLYFSFVGIFLWMWVSILWEDRALILLNGVGFAFLAVGIMKFHGAMWINFWSTLLWV